MKYRVGIDLGGTNIKAGLVDENYQILTQKSIPTRVERPAQEIMADMANLALELIKEQGICKEEVIGIGIGSPGTIDAHNNVVVYSNNFAWENVELGKVISQRTGFPVRISNDANCAALGEVKAGAAKGIANCIMITLGTGVGSGIILEGKIYEGGHPGGAEFGHTMLVRGGQPCSCGRRGCLEAYASATALIRDTKSAARDKKESLIWKFCNGNEEEINGKTVFDAAKAGDETALGVVRSYVEYLGDGLTDLVNIFRPDCILLSGGVCKQGAYLTVPLEAYLKENTFAGDKSFIPSVKTAELENSAGIIGAAALMEA